MKAEVRLVLVFYILPKIWLSKNKELFYHWKQSLHSELDADDINITLLTYWTFINLIKMEILSVNLEKEAISSNDT